MFETASPLWKADMDFRQIDWIFNRVGFAIRVLETSQIDFLW